MRAGAVLRALAWLAYPLAILFGLQLLSPRYVALLCAAALLLRRRRDAGRLLAGLSRLDRLLLAALLAYTLTTALLDSEALLRFYPLAVNAAMLALFAASLKNPPSMVERFARLREPALPPAGVAYTRQVTRLWCGFFVANGALAAYTALAASREVWAWYNGFIAYLLIGLLFAGEWLYRRFARRPEGQ